MQIILHYKLEYIHTYTLFILEIYRVHVATCIQLISLRKKIQQNILYHITINISRLNTNAEGSMMGFIVKKFHI